MLASVTAFAKINLALHVRGRREDGYHELETLFAFVDDGDRLTAKLADEDRITVSGEFAGALDNTFDNILARTLTKFPRGEGWQVHLEKNLPVAAGLGGGSADAGALIRMIADDPEDADVLPRAAALGADVPACVVSRTRIGTGTGTDLAPVEDDLAGTPVLLVNPRVPLATGPVFRGWANDGKGIDRGPLPEGSAREIALAGRNDLEAPAIALCPVIADVLDALRSTDPWLSRMSGSGATCFALYADTESRDRAAAAVAQRAPDWWRMSGALR